METNLWELFFATGDPLAYMLYRSMSSGQGGAE